jgi:hypothetical protein
MKPWRVFCYLDEQGVNIIRRWLNQHGISQSLRGVLTSHVHFMEGIGPRSLGGCIHPMGHGIHALKVERKGEAPIYVLFCYGPWEPFDDLDADSPLGEITLLTASLTGREELKYAMGTALENLQRLKRETPPEGNGRKIDKRTYDKRFGG